MDNDNNNENQIVLHEDKQYYKTGREIYGDDVDIMIEEMDTQPLEQPIIEPIKQNIYTLIEKNLPKTSFSYKFLTGLMDNPLLIRNIAFIGHLHHGKTLFMDTLVKETHINEDNNNYKEIRYTDTRKDEQSRGLSIKSTPMSLVLPDLNDKNYLINIIDTPGHVNFSDEMTASLRLSDGAIIIVDVCEGLLLNTKRAIIHASKQGIPICLVLNKMDRLIIELKLPPIHAYLKILNTLSEVNNILKALGLRELNPINNNVCFSSALFGWSFTLQSFAKMYCDYHNEYITNQSEYINYMEFSKKLFGNYYTHIIDGKKVIKNKPQNRDKNKRTFVEYILQPLYKIYSHVLGCDSNKLHDLFNELGIKLKKKELSLDVKPLLKVVLSKFFGTSKGFVGMIIQNIPPPNVGNKIKVKLNYNGNLNDRLGVAMLKCDSKSDISMVNVTKMYSRPDASCFDAFGRVFCGTINVGDTIKVMREGYSLSDNEDMSIIKITNIWIYQGRYRIEINKVKAGNWALFGGLDETIIKTATLTNYTENDKDITIFKPLQFNTVSVCKVAIEPIKPSELPKMTHALRCINKSYPLCITKVEESGEHVIIGTGELYLDCILHDLRVLFSSIEIKVSDPVVSFCETCEDTSSMQCFAKTPNKKNRITMICEPIRNKKLIKDLETNKINEILLKYSPKEVGLYFNKHYNWDILTGMNIWCLGPSNKDNKNYQYGSSNILINDTLISDKNELIKLNSIKNSIIQGFEWGVKEGPLCEEPIRNCIFKLINVNISDNILDRASGQIIPTLRRCLYCSFMLATPKLMEPIFFIEIMCSPDCIKAVNDVINQRRGRILSEKKKPGTPFIIINAEIPGIDSFGFETDLRSHTQGMAFPMQTFNRWDIIPGDPMDENIKLIPLQPHPPNKLSREFMIKTRKRKGLTENVTYHNYFDEEMFTKFAELYDDDD